MPSREGVKAGEEGVRADDPMHGIPCLNAPSTHVLLPQGCFAESWVCLQASQGAWRGRSKTSGPWGPAGSCLARTSLCSLPRESGSRFPPPREVAGLVAIPIPTLAAW